MLEVRKVTKTFPGVVANDDVSFELQAGEVHALLGENGAGKSTLASILTGLYRPDAGEIRLEGRGLDLRSPRQAMTAGIFMVHQQFRLVPSLSVADNILLGHRSEPWVTGSAGGRDEALTDLARRHGLDVDPRARVRDLSIGQRQRVEVLKALFRQPKVLILDEPTALLTPQEAEQLLGSLRQATHGDRAVVLISHRLNEVLEVADRITVLRRGRVVATLPAAECDGQLLARLMVGRDLPPALPRAGNPGEHHLSGPPLLELRAVALEAPHGLTGLRDISLQVDKGEILGVAGVAGNGQTLLAEVIAGLAKPDSGEVLLEGRKLHGGVGSAIRAGVGYIPEDRRHQAVAPGLTVAENLILRSRASRPFSNLGVLVPRRVERHARNLIQGFGIATTGPGAPVSVLSGGNIQKTVLARELSNDPRLVVAVSPTQGLDVSATRFVRETLRRVADEGQGVVLISDDLDEILELADRIAVMYRGRIAGEMTRLEADMDRLGLLMLGASG